MNKLIDYLSRKLFICLLLVTLSTIMLFMQVGKIDFQQWSTFIQWVFGIYAIGNVGDKVTNKDKNKK